MNVDIQRERLGHNINSSTLHNMRTTKAFGSDETPEDEQYLSFRRRVGELSDPFIPHPDLHDVCRNCGNESEQPGVMCLSCQTNIFKNQLEEAFKSILQYRAPMAMQKQGWNGDTHNLLYHATAARYESIVKRPGAASHAGGLACRVCIGGMRETSPSNDILVRLCVVAGLFGTSLAGFGEKLNIRRDVPEKWIGSIAGDMEEGQ